MRGPDPDNSYQAIHHSRPESLNLSLPEVSPQLARMRDFLAAQDEGMVCQGGFQDRRIVDLGSFCLNGGEIILIGDLHAHRENLSLILSHDDNHKRARDGTRAVVFLGDLVHCEEFSRLADMAPSAETLQAVMELKIECPQRIYTLIGNHDFLHNGLTKGGVNQSDLFRAHLEDHFGSEYINLYSQYISKGALMALGKGVVAVHAGPIHSANSLREIQETEIIDEWYQPESSVINEALWKRMSRGEFGAGHIKKFLETCGQPDAQLVVGHNPVDSNGWHWQRAWSLHVIHAGHKKLGYALIKNGRVEFVDVC